LAFERVRDGVLWGVVLDVRGTVHRRHEFVLLGVEHRDLGLTQVLPLAFVHRVEQVNAIEGCYLSITFRAVSYV